MAIPPTAARRPAPERAAQISLMPADLAAGTGTTGYPDMAALLEEWRQRAATIAVSDATLALWYAKQCEELWGRGVKLYRAVTVNLERLVTIDDARWPVWWEQQVRLEALWSALEGLRARGHVQICPSHGIPGVPWDAPLEVGGWLVGASLAAWWEALSLRGVLTGDGATAWTRYCLECQGPGLKDAARLRAASHAEPINMDRLRRLGFKR